MISSFNTIWRRPTKRRRRRNYSNSAPLKSLNGYPTRRTSISSSSCGRWWRRESKRFTQALSRSSRSLFSKFGKVSELRSWMEWSHRCPGEFRLWSEARLMQRDTHFTYFISSFTYPVLVEKRHFCLWKSLYAVVLKGYKKYAEVMTQQQIMFWVNAYPWQGVIDGDSHLLFYLYYTALRRSFVKIDRVLERQ